MNPFNGTLLSRKVIEQIGYVKREMFIWGDEREYQHRLERHAIAFGTVTQALFYHPCAQGRFEKVWKGKLGQVLIKPGHMAHIFYRNLGFLDRAYRGRRSAVMNLVRYTGYFLLNRRFDLRGLIKFFAYYLDGFLNTYKLDPALSQAPAVKEATA
jgi:rhamnopyranosyl-N-acetylglucosaminyl-diphospho-decaprenol beta-1,3/1,4-galactofuranosyltransferase